MGSAILSARDKARSEAILKQNMERYTKINKHEPYFALTPAGAKALQEHIAEYGKTMAYSSLLPAGFIGAGDGFGNVYAAVGTHCLQQFFEKYTGMQFTGKSGKPEAKTEIMSHFLGDLAGGISHPEPGEGQKGDAVFIEPDAVEIKASAKENLHR